LSKAIAICLQLLTVDAANCCSNECAKLLS
jgi:hypothetical protein